MKKSRYGFSLLLNILIFFMTAFGLFSLVINTFDLSAFAWLAKTDSPNDLSLVFQSFPNIAAVLLLIASFSMVIADIKVLSGKEKMSRWPVLMKFMATSAAFFGFCITYFMMLPKNGFSSAAIFDWRDTFWINTAAPLLAVISFLFTEFEPKFHFAWSFFCLLPSVVYFAVMLPLLFNGAVGVPPYFFMDVKGQDALSVSMWTGGLILFSFLIVVILFLVRKGLSIFLFGREEPRIELDSKKEKEGNDRHPKVLKIVSGKSGTSSKAVRATDDRVYHISRHLSGKWQVKLASSVKPIRLFKTQGEAISFAKELTKTQGGSIRVHSLLGKMRKG